MNKLLEIIGDNFTGLLIFAFGIVFIIRFHKQIGDVISRLTGVSFSKSSKIEFKDQSASQSLTDTKSNLKDADEESHFDPRLQPILDEQEKNIWADIKERYPQKYPEQRDDPLIKLLVKELAIVQVRAYFEFLYGLIFGSQIRLLRKINENGYSIPQNEIYAYFLGVQKEFPLFFKDDKIDNYLAFLLNNSLIIYQEESYDITVRGVEFLGWMTKDRKSESKYW